MDKFFSYIVWSIKYRPVKWNEVIGQMDITTILKNSIEKNRLSQILLFLGPRGVGKNTCARILANELNSFSNIFEISGFLNHSVKSIYETIHKIRSYPKNGKYNILIINDFNFIPQDSFNIILKIIEEPPSHVLFIFCTTTEKNKIFSIISRCQVYEFRHISLRDIFFYLKKIAEKERIEIDNEALFIISKNGNGSLSEALNTFEKLTFYDQKKISIELVMEKLGILDTGYYFKIIDDLLNQKISHVLILLDKIFQSGVSSINFIGGLTKHFRNLLLSKNTETLFLLKLKKKTIQSYIQQSRKICSSFLINALKICRQMEKESIIYNNSRLTIEIYLIQLANCLCTSSSFHQKDSDESSFHQKDSDESSFHQKDSDESSFHQKDSDDEKKVQYLQENWIKFIQKFSEKIHPTYLNSLKHEIQFHIYKNKILLVIPSQLETRNFSFIQTHFIKYFRNKLNNPHLEFKILVKEKDLENFPIEQYNSLSKKNKCVDKLIERLNLKILSSIPTKLYDKKISLS
ncbi:DNA polymerase III subunit delta [Blattabacterium cuenoti]|uniref:DNA polymerase III subunit delta n=1 Tax=Blattabacterium cuenoti TaxID=1653831 RepID=UPI00163CEED8|nr:AAA family ATPase [Blattabacterium cuenoti]